MQGQATHFFSSESKIFANEIEQEDTTLDQLMDDYNKDTDLVISEPIYKNLLIMTHDVDFNVRILRKRVGNVNKEL